MKKVLCIGHSAYDITILMNHFPTENQKYHVDKTVESGGGPANNAAYLMAKWNLNVYYAGVVGKDLFGERIKQELRDVGINIKYLETSKKYPTSTSYILVNLSSGSRTIFGYSDKNMKMSTKKIGLRPDTILVDGYDHELAMKTIKEHPKAISVLDAGHATEEVISLGKIVNYLVCSRDFAEQFTNQKIDLNNPKSLLDVYNIMSNEFKNTIVITLGENGCLYKSNDAIKLMSPYKVVPKDTTGAGDIFHGAFAYAITQGHDLEQAIKMASIAGALSVTKIGSKQSMPSLEDVMKVYNR
jgi:sugar/nucleoside kinase (ribokinase family)